MLQIIIGTVLALVLIFGIGFIINMLVKTTWFPIYAYIILIIVLAFWAPWAGDGTKMLENITKYTIVDFIPAVGGLLGAYLSGITIRNLRKGGYKMF